MTVLTKSNITVKKIPLIDESHCDEVRILIILCIRKLVLDTNLVKLCIDQGCIYLHQPIRL